VKKYHDLERRMANWDKWRTWLSGCGFFIDLDPDENLRTLARQSKDHRWD